MFPNAINLNVMSHDRESSSNLKLNSGTSWKTVPNESQIPVARKLLKRLHFLLRQLHREKDELQNKLDATDTEWQQEFEKTQSTKIEVTGILDKFSNDYINATCKRLDRLRKTRLQKRNQLKRKHEEERIIKNERRKLDKEINNVIAKRIEDKEKKKKAEELQKEIDSTLSEVRRKKREMSQQQNLHRALRKLRSIRQGTMPQSASNEDGEKFDRAMSKLEEFVRSRSIMYREEEKTMQVMLEGEITEMKAQEDERMLRKDAEAEAAKLKLQKEILFGEDISAKMSEEQSHISRFYDQADENIQCLLDIRKQWDAFIAEDHPEASGIPLSWVHPVPPSSDMWANTLTE